MTFVVAILVGSFLGVELARWVLRPEERRRRVIKKIGGRR